MPLCKIEGRLSNIDRFLSGRRWKKVNSRLLCHKPQLLYGGGSIDVAACSQYLLLQALAQELAQFAGGGGLARALKSGQQNYGRRLRREIEGSVSASHERREFAVHHAH